MNIKNLQILLQKAIDDSTNTLAYLYLARAIESLNMGQIRVVSTFAQLPSAVSNEGLLVFVESDERLYWSTGTDWYNIIADNKGLMWNWGDNCFGQLGNGTTTSSSSPVSAVGDFTDWCQVSAGDNHSLGVRLNGTAWSWGDNSYGKLGHNNTTDKSSPVSVLGGFTDWCQVSAGETHSLGIRCNGTIWSWGSNCYGQLGDYTANNSSSPVSVIIDAADWYQISAGKYHSLAITSDGLIASWGDNRYGQLGNDTTDNLSSPFIVVGEFVDWCQISAGDYHTLGLRCNGTIWSWGFNSSGQLGDNTANNSSSPVSVVGEFIDWSQISTGNNHSLGLRTNGTLWSWGCNNTGQLGDGTVTLRSSPVSVVGGFTDWCQISGGKSHSLGLKTDGTLWSWGCNNIGQLGEGTTYSVSSPVSAVGGFTNWCQVSAGGQHNLTLTKTDFS
jgi:alpha-tubulin suppressor-like RCC1 family protein